VVILFGLIFLLLFVLALFVLFWQGSNLISAFWGSPSVGAGKEVIRKSLKLANLRKGEKFYDLGSGNGESLIIAAEWGAEAMGFEISPYYYIWSKIRMMLYSFYHSRSSGNNRIFCLPRIYFRNIKKVDLSKADIVYCYLLPEFLEKLAPRFKKELKKSARLISISFLVPGLKLLSQTKFFNKTIYIYSASSRTA
jgi:SAM-dependent methyltransferase